MPALDSYIREKLGAAISTLALSPKSIQERLSDSFAAFITLKPSDFGDDEEDRVAFVGIIDALTAVKIESPRGYVGETTSRMTDDEAIEVARKILELYQSRLYAKLKL